ncbi:MAG TPA: T9SS type A sorting domain-containing protein, partial [Saprospiraceae bacterium]|nr:T9SS type A sorting domain-containing protein [Saprospiraceae bacterium]
ICKLDPNANFIWAKSMGSNSGEEGLSIAIDNMGSVYTTGFISDTTDFDPSTNVFNLFASGLNNIFISKLDVNGIFVWAKSIGNTEPCRGSAIAVDGLGKTYVTGYFQGTVDFDPGAGNLNINANGEDIFIVKLDTIGDFIWAKSMGGGNADKGFAIAADALGNVYSTGVFEGTADFDPNGGTFNLTAQFVRDMFICKLDNGGNLVWAKNITGSVGLSEGNDIVVDAFENIYTTGFYYGTVDFDFNSGIDNHVTIGAQDFFVMKIDQLPTNVESISYDDAFLVFPNPSNGIINIQNLSDAGKEKTNLTVNDINGNEVVKLDDIFNQNLNYKLSLSNYAKGIYLLKINTNSKSFYKKFVVM